MLLIYQDQTNVFQRRKDRRPSPNNDPGFSSPDPMPLLRTLVRRKCRVQQGNLLPESGAIPDSGSLIIGDKGKLYTPGDYGGGGHMVDLAGEAILEDPAHPVAFPVSKGHWEDFITAMRGGDRNVDNFPDYAGALAETILLGNLAVWPAWRGVGDRIHWDAEHLRVKNGRDVADQVEQIIRPTYRDGYSL